MFFKSIMVYIPISQNNPSHGKKSCMNLALKMLDTFLFLLQPAAGLPVMRMLHSLLHCSRNYTEHCWVLFLFLSYNIQKSTETCSGATARPSEKSRKEEKPDQLCHRWQQPRGPGTVLPQLGGAQRPHWQPLCIHPGSASAST